MPDRVDKMSGAMMSKVGNPQVYEDGDQKSSKQKGHKAEPAEGQKNAYYHLDPTDERHLHAHEKQEHARERQAEMEERAKKVTNPLEPAQRHGHKPSRGAQVDAQLQQEDQELVKKKGPYKGMSH